jgi:hypothetical protein
VLFYVCAPDSSEQRKKRRKNNKINARTFQEKAIRLLRCGRKRQRIELS